MTSGMTSITSLTTSPRTRRRRIQYSRNRLEVGGATPQTAVIFVVTRRYSSGLLNFAAHSSEDSQRDRKCRSVRLERTVPKGLFQYTIRRIPRVARPIRQRRPWARPPGRARAFMAELGGKRQSALGVGLLLDLDQPLP
jgi:hypothetical protein